MAAEGSDRESLEGNLKIIWHFFIENHCTRDEWSMKCMLCTANIKSKPDVTSNFHRDLRVSHV